MLRFLIRDQQIERIDTTVPVRGSKELTAEFRFYGDCWDAAKTLTVRYDCGANKYDVPLSKSGNGSCIQTVPWEAMEKARFSVAVIGDSTTPTTGVMVMTSASGWKGTGEAPAAPSKTVYDRIMEDFQEAVGAVGSIEAAMAAAEVSERTAKISMRLAAESESAARSYADYAFNSAGQAAVSADLAEASEKNAAVSSTAASASETAAKESASAASGSASAAAVSAERAEAAEKSAAVSSTAASASETAAKESASAASGSASAAAVSAERAEAATVHTPLIGIDNYWYLWDIESGAYIKTNILAEGQKGDTGASAYEYAVEGGYTGTEEEFAAVMADATARAERYAGGAADSAREAASSAEAAAASESAAGESASAAANSASAAQNAAASAYDLARIAADSAADAQSYRDETGSLLSTARQEIGEFNTAAASAKQDIADTGQAQVNAVNNAGSTQKTAIETAGQEHLVAVNDAGAAQKSAVEAAGVEQVDAVYAAGAKVQLTAKSLVINDIDNNKQYTASIQVKDGKPVLIYDELTT